MVLFMRQRLIASVLLSSAIFLSIPVPHSIGDTIVGGFITTDTVWDIGGSPYIAEQSILVMDGATLTIEPGVEVRFDPDKALSINEGVLVARGTEASNIVFTANASPPDVESNRWGYIGFWDEAVDASFDGQGRYTNGCILEYSVVEYAGGVDIQGATHADYCSPFIYRCVVKENSLGGIYFHASDSVVLTGNSICSNSASSRGGGIYFIYSDNAVMTDNSIFSNSASDGGGIFFEVSHNAVMTDNSICSNSASSRGGGIFFTSSHNAVMTDNSICSNYGSSRGGGIFFHASDNAVMTDNSICSNSASDGGGIYFGDSHNAVMTGNSICSNSASSRGGGIYFTGSHNAVLSSDPFTPTTIRDNISTHQLFNDNAYAGSTDPSRSGNIDARNVWWGTTNASEIADTVYDFFDYASTPCPRRGPT